MNILAIDPATKCGWATEKTIYGTWDLKTRKDESWGMKLIRFKSKLKEIHALNKLDLIVYERPAGRFKNPIITQSKIIGILETFCAEEGIQYRAYSSKEIKSFATGKGNANKPAMIKAAQEKYDYPGNDDNEADALHLWHLTAKEYTDIFD